MYDWLKQEPLFACSNCYEDSSYREEDLRVYKQETFCEHCWDEYMAYKEGMPPFHELEPFVSGWIRVTE